MEKPPVEKPPVEKPPAEQAASARPAAPTRDPSCADKAPECGHWASIGECDANPGYMMVSCASSCNMCDMLDYRKRCAVDETVPNPNPNPNPDPNPDPTLTLTLNLSPNPDPNPDPNPIPSPNLIPYPTQVPLSVGPGAMDETFRLASGAAFAHLEPSVLSADAALLQASCTALAMHRCAPHLQLILREPHLSRDEIVRLVEALRPLFPSKGSLAVHEKCADARRIAKEYGLGLHLSSVAAWSAERAEFDGPLGVSAHSEAEARAAAECGVQWAFLSPVAHPTSKPGDVGPPIGGQAVLSAQRALPDIDIVALGGISPESAARLASGGCRAVAVLGGVFRDGPGTQPEVACAAAASFCDALVAASGQHE